MGLTRFDCGLFYLNVDHARLFRGDVLAIVSEPRDEQDVSVLAFAEYLAGQFGGGWVLMPLGYPAVAADLMAACRGDV